MYATIDDMVLAFGIDEVTNLLADEEQLIDTDVVKAIMNDDLSALDADTTEAAQHATGRVSRALKSQSDYMDGFISRHYSLPLSESDKEKASQLQDCCLALARASLADDHSNSTDMIIDERKRWDDWLKQVATGKTLLPFPKVSTGTGESQQRLSATPKSSIDWSRY